MDDDGSFAYQSSSSAHLTQHEATSLNVWLIKIILKNYSFHLHFEMLKLLWDLKIFVYFYYNNSTHLLYIYRNNNCTLFRLHWILITTLVGSTRINKRCNKDTGATRGKPSSGREETKKGVCDEVRSVLPSGRALPQRGG
jgi:hypothetical protein